MSMTDCRGVPVSTQNRALLDEYEQAAELLAGYFVDPFAKIQAALEQDPGFAAGHCLRAGMIVTATDKNLVPLLAESVLAVEALGNRANARERAHIVRGAQMAGGRFRALGARLRRHPAGLPAGLARAASGARG